ncbi:MAG: AMP-binding protein [Caldilineaceae bacterium]|nr:AMP-binding protein [Caldilineaceae bacterium]
MILGGEDLKRGAAQQISDLFGGAIEIYNEYGPTEATVGCMIHRFDPQTDLGDSVPIGRPIANAQLYILDENLNPVPTGVIGEMCIGGAGVGLGYLKRPDLTAAKFVANPFQPGETLYRTGDLARWSADGQMQFLGRADHQVKVKGYRIELGEIESQLLAHPGINAAVVHLVQRHFAALDEPANRCAKCGLPENYPGAMLDSAGTCATCRDFDELATRFRPYFKTLADLQLILDEASENKRGPYDCLVLYSGGKDSTYMLYQLVKEMGKTPLVFCLDNGYISEQAKANIRRVTDDLGVELVFGQTPHMNAIFVDSLQRHSNVCDGCFKVIYTLSMGLAREKGITHILTGLSRGQLFETRLSDMFDARLFDVQEIDATVLAARKAYHRIDDAISQLMEVDFLAEERIFDEIRLIDFYRYCDVPLQEMYRYLAQHAPWFRPSDTGRSTNCLINDVGIYIHKKTRGFHNYALPYSWDVRVGHKTREEAVDELKDQIDEKRVQKILAEIGYDESEAARQLVAYVVPNEKLSIPDLRRSLKERLPDYMLPTHFVILESLPLTRNGKVDRDALPRPESNRLNLPTAFSPPETIAELRLAAIWKTVLNLPEVGIHDDFFDLGGDSISMIHVMMHVAEEFQIKASPLVIFDAPTVAELADKIEEILISEIDQLSDEEAERLLAEID